MTECVKRKISFIEKVNKAIEGELTNIESIAYDVIEKENRYDEFLVVHYYGGCIQARCCTGNSHSAILEELSNMLYTSQRFPRDTQAYKELKNN